MVCPSVALTLAVRNQRPSVLLASACSSHLLPASKAPSMRALNLLAVFVVSSLASAQAPGDLLWSAQLSGTMRASPVVGPDGSVYAATFQDGGRLYRLDGPTGAILVERDLPGTVEVSSSAGPTPRPCSGVTTASTWASSRTRTTRPTGSSKPGSATQGVEGPTLT